MSIAKKIIKSSVWLYLGQWFNRLIGLISTLIIARILTPDDFGLVASAMVVTSLFAVLTTTGQSFYLLRLKDITTDDLNTAWTIGLILKSLAFLGVFLSAGHVADFLEDQRLVIVLQILSLIPLINSFSNIGMVIYQKKMDYLPDFKLTTFSQTLSFITKISCALIYETYWAFIIAEIVFGLSLMVGSYLLSPFRPEICLKHWKKQWSFSQWVLLKGIFTTLRYRLDNLFVAKFFSANAVGLYSVTKDLATLPAGQIINPILNPLYVSLAEYIDRPNVFADKVQKSILATAIVAMPIAFGISVTGELLVDILLGSKWEAAKSIIGALAFISISGPLTSLLYQVLTVLGKVKASLVLDVTLGILNVLVFISLGSLITLVEFAELRVLLGFLTFFVALTYLSKISSISFKETFFGVSIPFFAALVMYTAVEFVRDFNLIDNTILSLMILVVIGGIIYLFLLISLVYLLKNKGSQFSFIWENINMVYFFIKAKFYRNI